MVSGPPILDPFLLELFQSELKVHGSILVKALESGLSGISVEHAAELARAANSIQSAARILSFEGAARLAGSIENTLKIDPRIISAEGHAALVHAAYAFQQMAGLPSDEIPQAIEAQDTEFRLLVEKLSDNTKLQQARDDLLAPLNPKESNAALQPVCIPNTSLLELFLVELQMHARTLDQGLVQAEANGSLDVLESLMRAAHSIKGAARIVGLEAAVELAHAMEDILSAAQHGSLALTSARVDALLEANDFFLSLSAVPVYELSAKLETESSSVVAITQSLRHLRDHESGAVASVNVRPGRGVPKGLHEKVPATAAPIDGFVRVLAENLTKLSGLSGESLIEVQSAAPLRTDLIRISREQMSAGVALYDAAQSIVEGSSANAAEYIQTACQILERLDKDLSTHTDNFTRLIGRLELVAGRLHREAIACRMCPFSDGVAGFPRMVRDLARSLDKSVRFDVRGEATRVDRDILAHLEAPLTHLLRNSVDHGLENRNSRIAAGKSPEGTLLLEARQVAGTLEVTIFDDGNGVDLDRVRGKLVDRSLTTHDVAASLSEAELLEFLFLPGFSTAQKLTDVSGRGVGLNVVQTMIREVGGSIRVENRPRQGCTFRLNLPLTLSVLRCLVVEIGNEPYAFPLTHLEGVYTIALSNIDRLENRRFWRNEAEAVGLIEAAEVLRCKAAPPSEDHLTIVVVGENPAKYGLIVDRMLGHRDLVVIPLDPRLGKIPTVSAGAILEDGRTVLLLDSREIVDWIERMLSEPESAAPAPAEPGSIQKMKKILVVDDSITVRQLQRRLLTNHGYEVVLAVDGVDGWNAIQSECFDLVITDVDMPRLNGIDLVRRMKASSRTADIPVMIVSYRSDDSQRRQGLDAGASYYLSKSSFDGDGLLTAVADLVGEGSAQ